MSNSLRGKRISETYTKLVQFINGVLYDGTGTVLPISTSGLGFQGPQGSRGLQGTTGVRGISGDSGPQGPVGLTGVDGPQGPAGGGSGSTGPQGPAGLTGVDGSQGPAGLTGVDGPQGPAGLTGVDGPQGPAGDENAIPLTGTIENFPISGSLQFSRGDYFVYWGDLTEGSAGLNVDSENALIELFNQRSSETITKLSVLDGSILAEGSTNFLGIQYNDTDISHKTLETLVTGRFVNRETLFQQDPDDVTVWAVPPGRYDNFFYYTGTAGSNININIGDPGFVGFQGQEIRIMSNASATTDITLSYTGTFFGAAPVNFSSNCYAFKSVEYDFDTWAWIRTQ